MKKLLLNTLLIASIFVANNLLAQERKAVESKPEPASKAAENKATVARPANPTTKNETQAATPATPATPASKSETRTATPATPAQPAGKLAPAKNVKKAEVNREPAPKGISVNEGGLPATKTESKKAD